MSGTSLDGLDIAYCIFQRLKSGWKYSIEHCETVRYSRDWQIRLSQAHLATGEELMALDAAYGSYLGKVSHDFITRYKIKVDFIASHGHTIFHRPARRFTTQIGNGYCLHADSSLPVICDFRSEDVAFGGEGAPLVPAGDRFLFNEYEICLNLGGIANMSLDVKGKRIAFDICFCNMGLNLLAGEAGKAYDRNGSMAAGGSPHPRLLKAIDKVYAKLRTKRPSLGREIFEDQVIALLKDDRLPLADRLSTFTESTAMEIGRAIRSYAKTAKVLCTGGGVFNSFLMSRLLEYGGDDITLIIPDEEVVKFKEAMVFAFLGVLRMRDEVNCLKSVTKASRDSSSGTMIGF
jgi:anhydro-N-acetylmuramic acid kinase